VNNELQTEELQAHKISGRKSEALLTAAKVPIEWHSGLPICASGAYLHDVSDEYGWIGGTDETGRKRCVLPYTVIRKPGFRIVRFRTETIPLDGELEIEEERAFLNSAVECFQRMGMDMIIPGANTAMFRTYPVGAIAAPYGTFLKDLRKTEDELWRETSEAYRKDIRRAIKSGVQVEHGNQYLEGSYDIFADTMKRSKATPKGFGEFKSLILALRDNVRVFVAAHEGKLQACLVVPFSQHTAYTLYGGTIPSPVRGSMHLLHWEAIRYFHALQVQRFNFTGVRIRPQKGSKQEGILTFKMRFGGELKEGFMWKYPLNKLKFAAYCAAVRVFKGGDVVDQERSKLVSS
jgi:hypothetical protein